MTRDDWLELTVLERKKYNLLVEIQDATRQLAETLDRNDEVAVRMVVTMRQDPIRHLAEVDDGEKVRRAALPKEDDRRVKALLEGEKPQDDGESAFMDQVGKTRRLLEQVMDLDRRISIRMAGNHSFYKK